MEEWDEKRQIEFIKKVLKRIKPFLKEKERKKITGKETLKELQEKIDYNEMPYRALKGQIEFALSFGNKRAQKK